MLESLTRHKRLLACALTAAMLVSLGGGLTTVHSETKDKLYESFQTPEDRAKPAPLWFWNREVEDMTTDQARELVRESYKQSGYSGFGILPEWQSSYLTDEYFELYEAALDEGSKYGMKFSLYDEDGFPSYNAGGLLAEQYPELTTKRLDMVEADGKDGQTVTLHLPEGKLMGAVAMNTDTYERVDVSDKAVIKGPAPFDPESVPVGVSASTTYTVSPGYEADKAVDGDLGTRWNAESMSGGKQTLTIRFEAPASFDHVKIYEDKDPGLQRTQKFSVEYYDYEKAAWVELAAGKAITDAGADLAFPAVTADMVRLHIQKISGDSATISEFQVFEGDNRLAVPPAKEPEKEQPGVSGSSRYNADYDAAFAFDGSFDTRWNAADATHPPHWLQMDFGGKRRVDNVKVYQSMDRISEFQIQYWTGGEWKTCYDGTKIGLDREGSHIAFDAVETTKMRLYISATSDYNPSIWELEFYDGDTLLTPEGGGEPGIEGSYLQYTVPEGNWKVMAFLCVVDTARDGMDYLNKDSVKAFIDITYEAYYKRFKKYFDNGTITSAFFDEPSFWPAGGRTPYGAEGGRFWTPGFNEDYEARFGSSPALDYPALFMDIGADTNEARDKFQYVRTELFADNYIGQLNEWCADHGIELTGHILFEEWVNPVGSEGDLMKVFKNQAVPGVDIINNVGFSQEAYKVVSSSAYNWDKGKVMAEAFGVFPGHTMDDFYRCSMDIFAKGVNLIVPHALWYDNDPRHVTYTPEMSYRNPEIGPHLSELSDYIARAHTLLQNGRHVADIAMLYPIDYLESAFYFNEDPNNPADADYMQISELLSLNARRDFTYLHPDIIDERCAVEGDTFRLQNEINSEAYKVFIMPGGKVVSLSNLEKIKAFYDGGGKVIATTQLPYMGTRTEDDAKVKAIIKEMFGFDPENPPAIEHPVYRSSSNYSGGYAANMAFDGVLGDTSRWNAGGDGGDQWLEVAFPQPLTIDRTVITERFDRVTGYEIQYFDEGANSWKTCHSGGALGVNKEDRFTPVKTRRLRLYVKGVNANSVSIEEFAVYGGDSGNLALDQTGITAIEENTAGGKAYFIGSNPQKNLPLALDDALAVYDVEMGEIPAVTDGNFSYIHKVKEDRNIYFFANSSADTVETTVQLRGELTNPMFWDPATGERRAAGAQTSVRDGETVTTVKLELSPIQSVFLLESLPGTDAPDKTALKAALAEAETIRKNLDAYADGKAKDAFHTAYHTAKTEYDSPDADKEAVDTACAELGKAVKALRLRADTAELRTLLEKAGKIDETLYTAETAAVFHKAWDEAETIAADKTLTAADQKKVDDAAEKLDAAMKALALKDESDETDDSSSETVPESETTSATDTDPTGTDDRATTDSATNTGGQSSGGQTHAGSPKTGAKSVAGALLLFGCAAAAAGIAKRKKA